MRRRYSETQVKGRLQEMGVLVDTREQVWNHIEDTLGKKKISVQRGKLPCGDYTALLPDEQGGFLSLEDEVIIERKANLDEIAGNFTVDRRRFEAEFLRAKAAGVKVFLLVENASWRKIYSHDYRSKMAPKALAASLLAWQVRYGITLLFCQPEDSGRIIYSTLYYWAKERLEGGAA